MIEFVYCTCAVVTGGHRAPNAACSIHKDERWQHALDGLQVVAFVYRPQDQRPGSDRVAYPLPAEVTGLVGDYLYVVLDGEEEPRKVHWAAVRPR